MDHHNIYTPLDDNTDITTVQECGLGRNLLRGAVLRVTSDLTGGTPLESLKCRVAISTDNIFSAYSNIVKESGFWGLWSGASSRAIEGTCVRRL